MTPIKKTLFFSIGLFLFPISAVFGGEAESYSSAITQTALHQPFYTHKSLLTIEGTEARMLAFTAYNGYKPSDDKLGATIWVTLDPEIKKLCAQYVRDHQPTHEQLTLWIVKLLGLPPNNAENRRFVLLDVPVIQAYYGEDSENIGIFRPCTDPRITAHPDSAESCPRIMDINDKNITSDFKTWFINNSINAHSIDSSGAPWTEYGYTYNWNEDATDVFGVSEFVILKNTPVHIVANPDYHDSAYFSAEEYCQ